MAPKSLASILLSSLLYSTTNAFVPLNIHPPVDNNIQPQAQPHATPSAPDPAYWVPIETLAPIPYIPSPMPTPTPTPSDTDYHLPFGLDALLHPDLHKRQGAPVAPPTPQPTAGGQLSPITTYFINSEVAPGSFAQVPVVYTQTFPPTPDQWPSPLAGTIGLGTIQGTVGGIRSKREEPTQAPMPVETGTAGDTAVRLEMEARKTKSWSA
ncbi:hypothetical protein H2200_003415 [Cladophialophora chaetospira]|uniref:Uncharacterized protein n=1 Tax=Cladophialophora chaetospira TaxID=386627 RepID=A0AA39CMQ5_9EURO|nr:hypothetical protein H2200_003415 [Cladophialophora chaetospira]